MTIDNIFLHPDTQTSVHSKPAKFIGMKELHRQCYSSTQNTQTSFHSEQLSSWHEWTIQTMLGWYYHDVQSVVQVAVLKCSLSSYKSCNNNNETSNNDIPFPSPIKLVKRHILHKHPNSQLACYNFQTISKYTIETRITIIPTASGDSIFPSFSVLTIFWTSSLVPFCRNKDNTTFYFNHYPSKKNDLLESKIKVESKRGKNERFARKAHSSSKSKVQTR